MATKPESTARNLTRSLAMGVLLSMLFTYALHVFGKWDVEFFRPDAQTTSSVILYNKCVFFGATHVLRPNTGITAMSDGVDPTKLEASFMNFTGGHVTAMLLTAVVFGLIIFTVRKSLAKRHQ